jgi:hypothetical protein
MPLIPRRGERRTDTSLLVFLVVGGAESLPVVAVLSRGRHSLLERSPIRKEWVNKIKNYEES